MENLNNRMVNPEDVISQFKEDFELDLRDENYEKILPILPLANSARFIHDFSAVIRKNKILRFLIFIINLLYFRMSLVL